MPIKKLEKSLPNQKDYLLIPDKNGPSLIAISTGVYEGVVFRFGKVEFKGDDHISFEFEVTESTEQFQGVDFQNDRGFTDFIFSILIQLLAENMKFKYGI